MATGFGKSPQSEKKPIVTAKGQIATIDQIQKSLSGYFAEIKDPRVARTQKHLLNEILIIAILAVIAGAEGWEDIIGENLRKKRKSQGIVININKI
jgi:hypothetical protein